MNGGMPSVGKWLRPPRSILIFFVLVVCVPAATLIAFGIRLLDQDRALAHQRRLELLDRAADQGCTRSRTGSRGPSETAARRAVYSDELPYDAVCVVLSSDRIDAVPSQRIPYYPVAQALKEMPSDPFLELESNEFREPVHLDKALEMSRTLAASSDPAVRAGALLRESRILRKLGQTRDALAALGDLSTIASISIDREPSDLSLQDWVPFLAVTGRQSTSFHPDGRQVAFVRGARPSRRFGRWRTSSQRWARKSSAPGEGREG